MEAQRTYIQTGDSRHEMSGCHGRGPREWILSGLVHFPVDVATVDSCSPTDGCPPIDPVAEYQSCAAPTNRFTTVRVALSRSSVATKARSPRDRSGTTSVSPCAVLAAAFALLSALRVSAKWLWMPIALFPAILAPCHAAKDAKTAPAP
jgi:hypothetical protein